MNERRFELAANPNVVAYCAEAVDRIRRCVGDNLLGVYLHGSLVLGDFAPSRSDVDLLAVSESELPPEAKVDLRAALSPGSLPCPAGGLEFSLVTRSSLKEVTSAPAFEVHIATDTKAATERCVDGSKVSGDTDLVMHYAVLRSHGMALFGPPASDVFPDVPRELLLRALRGELDWATKNASSSYQLLNAARAWRFLEDNVICSKSEGGEWARLRVADPSIFDVALAHRRGKSDLHPDTAKASEFVDEVVGRLTKAIKEPPVKQSDSARDPVE